MWYVACLCFTAETYSQVVEQVQQKLQAAPLPTVEMLVPRALRANPRVAAALAGPDAWRVAWIYDRQLCVMYFDEKLRSCVQKYQSIQQAPVMMWDEATVS